MDKHIVGKVAIIVLACAVLNGCDAGPSAVLPDGSGSGLHKDDKVVAEAPKAQPNDQSSNPIADQGPEPAPEDRAKSEPETGHYKNWPLWSVSSKYSADDNAHYQFSHHASEFGISDYQDWLAHVHGFIHHPPKSAESFVRNNGDTLIYDSKNNIFAVMTKDGAPRIMMKPETGAQYWQEQKASGGAWKHRP